MQEANMLLASVHQYGRSVLNDKKLEMQESHDILGALIRAAPENPDLTDHQIIAETFTFLIGGSETTSSLLSWTIYKLAIYPEL
jgi:cytochrome P450